MSTYNLIKAERLPDSLSDYLEDLDLVSLENLQGGFTSDSKLCWVASDSYLEVVRVKLAQTVSRWNFGSVLKVTTSKITSVDELKSSFNDVLMLVVGLEFLGTAGMVCIFDIYSMKIVRAIQIPEKVTFVHVIYNGNETTTFPGMLNSFDGALAVGTANGNVYIVDLCREVINEARQITLTPKIKDEVDPCNLIILRPEDLHRIESHKESADRKGNHLAIHLNALIGEQSPHFILKGPQGDTRLFVNKEEVFVSSLYFAPQLSSLLVGYNFGALQIWDLISTDLVYTSPVHEENIPITHFTVQEPVDDPRAFCYFWAVYCYKDSQSDTFPVAALYSLCYESKEWHEGYGYIYQNLQSCNIRFQTDLTIMNIGDIKDPIGGQCIRLHSFSNNRNRDLSSSSITEPFDDSYKLCLMAWNVWCKDRTSHIFLSVFDLNQWYKEQMPNFPHKDQSKKYMTTVCLSDVAYKHCDHKFPSIDVHINPTTISFFKGAQKLEEHYYPTSLAFECYLLSEYEICHLKNFGTQRKFYHNLGEDGPLALLKPAALYETSVEIGLTPLFMESLQVNHTNATHQREFLLSIALENKMKNWLFKCASSWGNGSHRIAGLSLDLMLNWAWERAKVLKANADIVCTTLFDYSGIKLDQNTKGVLNKCRGQILVIRDLYKYIITNCKQYLVNSDLTSKQHKCLERIYAYLDVLGWMYNVGLLPEHRMTYAHQEDTLIPYSLIELRKMYEERRSELRLLNGKKELFDGKPILFIDKFIETCGSHSLEEEWSQAGGGSHYPPSSLQALLRTYLVEDMELHKKHIIVSYLFMDIADSLDPVVHKISIANLLKFPVIFQFNRSQLKLIQGFWHLDHNQLGSAGELFIDPMLEPRDLEPWHHKQILSTFMLQDANKLALLYLTFQRPPINDIDDVSTVIAVYVSNGMLHEAFSLQRQHSKREDTTLLNVIFREVLRTDQLKDLIPMTLTRKEEEELIEFLDKLCYHDRNEFKAVYFAIRGRYFDFRLHVKPENSGGEFSLSNTCRDILDSMVTSDDKKIVELCLAEKRNLLKSSKTPKPMSTFLYNKEENAKYKSNFIYACVAKSHEIWKDAAERESYFQNKNAKICGDDFPFLRSLNATPFKQSYNSELIYPEIVTTFMDHEVEEDGPSPVKRMKLSPRQTVHTPQTSKQDIKKLLTNFDTPVITASRMQESTINEATPQSILKGNSVQREVYSRMTQLLTPKCLNTEDDNSVVSSTGKRIILTPSKRRSVVRFTGVSHVNSPDSFSKNSPGGVQRDISPLPNITNTSISHKPQFNVDDESTTESFYSPEVSSNNADMIMEEEYDENEKSTIIKKDNRIEDNDDTTALSITNTKFSKTTSSTSLREKSFVKKLSVSVEERSYLKKSTSIVEERSLIRTRTASPFKASRIIEDFNDSEKPDQETKDNFEADINKSSVQERRSLRDSSLSNTKRFDSPVPATLRSRKSYKGDVVKRFTRSSLFIQEEDFPEVFEKKEHDDDPRDEEPSVSVDLKRSKSPVLEQYSSQKVRRSILLTSSENDIQSPLSRRSYRGENIQDNSITDRNTNEKSEAKTIQQEEQVSEDELMEVISLSSRTTVDTMDTKNTDEEAAFYEKHIRVAGLDEDSSASSEDQNQGDVISIGDDSNDDNRTESEDVRFAHEPEFSEEDSDGDGKRKIAGKIIFDVQEEDGDDCDQSRLAVTLDSMPSKSRLDFDIEENEKKVVYNRRSMKLVKSATDTERKSNLGFGVGGANDNDEVNADTEDSASLHDSEGENICVVEEKRDLSINKKSYDGPSMASNRSVTTVSGRRPVSAGVQSVVTSQRSSTNKNLSTVLGKRAQSTGHQSVVFERSQIATDSSTRCGRRSRISETLVTVDRSPNKDGTIISDPKLETVADVSTSFSSRPTVIEGDQTPEVTSSTVSNEPIVSDRSLIDKTKISGRSPKSFSKRSIADVRKSIISYATTEVLIDSDNSVNTSDNKSEKQIETISLSSKTDSVDLKKLDCEDEDQSPKPRSRSRSKGRTSLRTSIFKPVCRKSLHSNSLQTSDSTPHTNPNVSVNDPAFSEEKIGLNMGFMQSNSSEESSGILPSMFFFKTSDTSQVLSPNVSMNDSIFSQEKRLTIGLNVGFVQNDSMGSVCSEISKGDISNFGENRKDGGSVLDDTEPSFVTFTDSSANLLEINVTNVNFETSPETPSTSQQITMIKSIKYIDTAIQTTLIKDKIAESVCEEGKEETSADRENGKQNKAQGDMDKKETMDSNIKQKIENQGDMIRIEIEDQEDQNKMETSEVQEDVIQKDTNEVHIELNKNYLGENVENMDKTCGKDTNQNQMHEGKGNLNKQETCEDQGDLNRKEATKDQGDAGKNASIESCQYQDQNQVGESSNVEVVNKDETLPSKDNEERDSDIPQKLAKTVPLDNIATTPRKLRKRDETILLDSPARRTRSVTSSGSSPLPTRTLRTRTKSTDLALELPKTPVRRRRSFSVKESEIEKLSSPVTRNRRASTSTEPGVSMAPVTRRTTRSKSVDLEEPSKATTSRGRGKKAALPAISEDKPVLEEYTENRRLTRRQKELFTRNLKGDGDDDEKYDINLQSIDPIQLLDKEDFKGRADPDEQQLLQHSPAPSVISSSTTETGPVNRKERGHSSDRSASEISYSKRNLRSLSKPKEDTPMPVPVVARRTRRASVDSVASDRSDDVKPGVKKQTTKHTLSNISEDSQEDAPKAKSKRCRPRKP